jgi:hypothetical protein
MSANTLKCRTPEQGCGERRSRPKDTVRRLVHRCEAASPNRTSRIAQHPKRSDVTDG